jgi:hypothetical protein
MKLSSLNEILLILLITVLSGCASAPELSDVGSKAREITEQDAKHCKFIKIIQYNDRIYSFGKDPTIIRSIGVNNIKNKVGSAGANAYVTTKDDSNWFMGSIAYQADAYKCP